MSYSFESHAGTGAHICGHDDVDEHGTPTGGYATDSDGSDDFGAFRLDHIGAGKMALSGSCTRSGLRIRWQDGPVDRAKGAKPNGAFVEDILEVCKRRLEHYQKSAFACEENAIAMQFIDDAIVALTARRRDRISRGVQGKNEK